MRGELDQASCWMFCIFYFFGSSQYPIRLVSFTPFYGIGEHKRYKLNDLPTVMQPHHSFFFYFGALVSPTLRPMLSDLWHCIGKTRAGKKYPESKSHLVIKHTRGTVINTLNTSLLEIHRPYEEGAVIPIL